MTQWQRARCRGATSVGMAHEERAMQDKSVLMMEDISRTRFWYRAVAALVQELRPRTIGPHFAEKDVVTRIARFLGFCTCLALHRRQ